MSLIEKINGYKMYIGGAGAILIGMGQFLYDWQQGSVQDYKIYLTWLIAGWTIIGGKSAIKKVEETI